MARGLGRAWREARNAGADVAAPVVTRSGRTVAFRGTFGANDRSAREGFTFGSFEIEGTGAFAGHRFQVEVKNENLVALLD